jgi:hypothetical protein
MNGLAGPALWMSQGGLTGISHSPENPPRFFGNMAVVRLLTI